MFERFTDRARRVIHLAQEEARMLNHNYIGTEHLLLGLTHEGEAIAAHALTSLGLDLDAVRKQVEEIIGRGQQAPGAHLPFTPRAKKVLELSLREAMVLGHNYIGTEHILLGLIREGEGVAARVLVANGLELEAVRTRVIAIVNDAYPPKDEPEEDLLVTDRFDSVIAELEMIIESASKRSDKVTDEELQKIGRWVRYTAPIVPGVLWSDSARATLAWLKGVRENG